MSELRRYNVPTDVMQIVEQARRELRTREGYTEQVRDYRINCANGDRVDIHEETRVWIRETE